MTPPDLPGLGGMGRQIRTAPNLVCTIGLKVFLTGGDLLLLSRPRTTPIRLGGWGAEDAESMSGATT